MTKQEQEVTLEALGRELDNEQRVIANVESSLADAKEAGDETETARLKMQLAKRKRILKAVEEQVKLLSAEAKPKAAKAATRAS